MRWDEIQSSALSAVPPGFPFDSLRSLRAGPSNGNVIKDA
jgi:hypothetical protein